MAIMHTNVLWIEFAGETGDVELLGAGCLEELGERSAKAAEQAMAMIKDMAGKTVATLDGLPVKPDQSEIEFGVVFRGEANALIAKTAAEASIKVKLTWKHSKV